MSLGIDDLLRMACDRKASDLHLKVGQPPMMRIRGDIRRVDMRPLTQEDMERLLLTVLKPHDAYWNVATTGALPPVWLDEAPDQRLAV